MLKKTGQIAVMTKNVLNCHGNNVTMLKHS